MPRVKSDDMAEKDDDGRHPEKLPSPIGAGLPLLQRLRLLKEKQVRYQNISNSLVFHFFFSRVKLNSARIGIF